MFHPNGPFDPNKHPRGWGGRWSDAGRTSNAHAMATTLRRPEPHPMKRIHAVSPVIRGGLRPMTVPREG